MFFHNIWLFTMFSLGRGRSRYLFPAPTSPPVFDDRSPEPGDLKLGPKGCRVGRFFGALKLTKLASSFVAVSNHIKSLQFK